MSEKPYRVYYDLAYDVGEGALAQGLPHTVGCRYCPTLEPVRRVLGWGG